MNSEFAVAVHALVYLQHRGECLSSRSLAENICTNPVCVRRVMEKLAAAGLAEARRGSAGGGYSFRRGKETTLLQIADAVGARFVEAGWRSGDPHRECLIASGMAAYLDELYAGMDAACRKKLSKITVADVEQSLLARGRSENTDSMKG